MNIDNNKLKSDDFIVEGSRIGFDERVMIHTYQVLSVEFTYEYRRSREDKIVLGRLEDELIKKGINYIDRRDIIINTFKSKSKEIITECHIQAVDNDGKFKIIKGYTRKNKKDNFNKRLGNTYSFLKAFEEFAHVAGITDEIADDKDYGDNILKLVNKLVERKIIYGDI